MHPTRPHPWPAALAWGGVSLLVLLLGGCVGDHEATGILGGACDAGDHHACDPGHDTLLECRPAGYGAGLPEGPYTWRFSCHCENRCRVTISGILGPETVDCDCASAQAGHIVPANTAPTPPAVCI